MNTLNLYELYNLCVWCVYVCMYAGLFWLSICLWLNQNQISWLEQTMPWPGYVMLFNPLTHFYQFQKVDRFVDGWKKLLWILRDSFSKFVLRICSFENGRSHLRQMFYAIWSLILKIRAYQQVFSCSLSVALPHSIFAEVIQRMVGKRERGMCWYVFQMLPSCVIGVNSITPGTFSYHPLF